MTQPRIEQVFDSVAGFLNAAVDYLVSSFATCARLTSPAAGLDYDESDKQD